MTVLSGVAAMLLVGSVVLACSVVALGNSTAASSAGINSDLNEIYGFFMKCLFCCWFIWLGIKKVFN